MAVFLLVDGNNLMFRAHYALERQRLKTRSGRPSGALFGFAKLLLKLLQDENPDFAAVAFDVSKDTFRRKLYPEYKAHRKPTPPEILDQLPQGQILTELLGLKLMRNPEFEADDLIGTAAETGKAEATIHIFTGDRDFLQLLDERVLVKLCSKGISEVKDFDRKTFEAEYGFPPEEMVDYKALLGDSSDNIPGVEGIGEKKAMALIQEYGTIETLYGALEKVSNPRMKQQLADGKDSAFLSKHLATIKRDIPGFETLEEFRWAGFGAAGEKLYTFFKEWDFLSLLPPSLKDETARKEGPGKESPGQESPGRESPGQERPRQHLLQEQPAEVHEETSNEEITGVPGEKLFVTTVADLKAFLDSLGKEISLDVETDGFDPRKNKIVGISLAGNPEKAVYVPLRHSFLGMSEWRQPAPEEVFPLIQRALKGRTLVGHNLKFDLAFLAAEGVFHRGEMFDTMLAAYVLDPTTPNGLKPIARDLLNVDAVDFSATARGRSFAQVPIDEATQYSCQDVILPLILAARFRKELQAKNLYSLFHELEMPLVPLLLEMETTGIGLNQPYLKELAKDFTIRILELEKTIHLHAGYEFNVNSGKQLQEVLFGKLQLEPPRKTKTGFSTDAEVLQSLEGAHPIIGQLLEYRELMKLKTTYADSLTTLVIPATGLIHTSFNQMVTATGRLSSSNPNMQNIPIKTDLGRKIRRSFVPPRARDVFLSIDYSQIELRLLAHFSEDPQLLEAYRENLDIHAITAAKLFGKDQSEVTSADRKVGKTVNFGIIYGISAHGLAQSLSIPRVQGQQYIDGFFRTYPKAIEYFKTNLEQAKARGYVSTLLGRVRPMPELASQSRQTKSFGERVARNTPLQGSAADLVKKAMLDCDSLLKKRGLATKLILQIHDEIIFSCPPAEVEEAGTLLKACMEETVKLRVPLVCDVAVGPNLADLKE